eukprot:SAG11_NODE_24244_length_376_cov_0.754513_2_plen_56_part_01
MYLGWLTSVLGDQPVVDEKASLYRLAGQRGVELGYAERYYHPEYMNSGAAAAAAAV